MKIKKIASAIVALAMMACMSVTVFAASAPNAYEQQILDLLSAPIVNAAGVERSIPGDYITTARFYFERDDVDVTEEEAGKIIAQISAARTAVANDDSTSGSALPQSVINDVMTAATAAAAVMDLTLTYNANGGIAIRDANGTVIFNRDANNVGGGAGNGGSSVIKQMGFGVNALWVVLASIAVLAFAGYAIFARRRNAVAAK